MTINLVQSFSKSTRPLLTTRSIGPLCAACPEDEQAPRWWLTSGVKRSDGNVARVSQGCMADLASLPARMRAVCRPRRRISPFHQKSRTRGEWMHPRIRCSYRRMFSASCFEFQSTSAVHSTHSATRGCSNGTETAVTSDFVMTRYAWQYV